jgi:hypothetical protein
MFSRLRSNRKIKGELKNCVCGTVGNLGSGLINAGLLSWELALGRAGLISQTIREFGPTGIELSRLRR